MIYTFQKQNANSVCMVGDRAFFYGAGGVFRLEPDNTLKEVFSAKAFEMIASGTRALVRKEDGTINISDDYGDTWKTSSTKFTPIEYSSSKGFIIVAGNNGSFIAYKNPQTTYKSGDTNCRVTTADSLYGSSNGLDWVHRTRVVEFLGSVTSYDVAIRYNIVFDGNDFLLYEYNNDKVAVTFTFYKLSITQTNVSEETLFTSNTAAISQPNVWLTATSKGLFIYNYITTYPINNDYTTYNVENLVSFIPKNASGQYDFSKITANTTAKVNYLYIVDNIYHISPEQDSRIFYSLATDSLVAHVPQSDGSLRAIPFFTFANYSVNIPSNNFEIFSLSDDLAMLVVSNASDATKTVGLYSIYWGNSNSPTIQKCNSNCSPRKFLGGRGLSHNTTEQNARRNLKTLSAIASRVSGANAYYAFLMSDTSNRIVLYHVNKTGGVENEALVQGNYNAEERNYGKQICLAEDKQSYYLVNTNGECQFYQAFPKSKTEDEFVLYCRDEKDFLSATVKSSNPHKTTRKGLVYHLTNEITFAYGETAKAQATFDASGNATKSVVVKTTEGVQELDGDVYHGQCYSSKKFLSHAFGGFLTAPVFDFNLYCTIGSAETCKYEFALNGVNKLTGTWSGDHTQAVSFSLTENDWNTLVNGDHILTLKTYACNKGGTTPNTLTESVETYTFKKIVNTIAFITKTLDGAKGTRPIQIACAIHAALKAGQTRIYACNNAYDAAPTWEEITDYVGATAISYSFQNKVKTAARWGVAIKFETNNEAADNTVWISSMSGGFSEES